MHHTAWSLTLPSSASRKLFYELEKAAPPFILDAKTRSGGAQSVQLPRGAPQKTFGKAFVAQAMAKRGSQGKFGSVAPDHAVDPPFQSFGLLEVQRRSAKWAASLKAW